VLARRPTGRITVRRFISLLIASAIALIMLAPPAAAVVCHDYPGGCCDAPLARKLGMTC
jgi:hypothetical protein